MTSVSSKIAVLIPCLNEEQTVRKVVQDFQRELPGAEIVVFDNASTDRTSQEAVEAGAAVFYEGRRGKGYVVQSMFEKVNAEFYVIVDGDDTYPAERVAALMAPVLQGQADMTVGSRIAKDSQSDLRLLNLVGNKFYLGLINAIFHTRLTDILSGYRCMNRKFVKGVPIFVTGFEVETELTIKALERGFQICEVPVDLRSRPEGSHSKIKIVRDGLRILGTIFSLVRDYKPLTFFGFTGMLALLAALAAGWLAMLDYLRTGQIFHIPAAVSATGLALIGIVSIFVGIILHTINRRFQELEYYLRLFDQE
jgi:glycosyltransferase involved in cell wall biosynthesis